MAIGIVLVILAIFLEIRLAFWVMMGMTISFVGSLLFLPVVGGVAGRASRGLDRASDRLRPLPWLLRAALVVPAAYGIFLYQGLLGG